MRSLRGLWNSVPFFILLLLCGSARAEIEIVLQNGFIEAYKDRATIDVDFVVDKSHARPNPGSKDGDLHIAGRAEEVKLPIVAEIMNAKEKDDAVDLVKERQGSDEVVAMSGAWRFWCEHGGTSRQVQGEPLEQFTTTNPDHVFEIHPVTDLNGKSLLDTLHPIKGYDPKDAHNAFTKYEDITSEIRPNKTTTTIRTRMAGFNYVEFAVRLSSEEKEVEDGRFVMGQVCDLEGELLVRKRRMVFIKDSDPEIKTRGAAGELVHVLGIPRINLTLVDWRRKEALREGGNKEVLEWSLPYEIIVVAYYGKLGRESEDLTAPVGTETSRATFIPRDVNLNERREDLFERESEEF